MFYNDNVNQEMPYGFDNEIDINITNENINTNMNTNTNMNMNDFGGETMMGTVSCPVVEPARERCVYRNIVHEVPHVCPINTRIINNHIYRHTYQPRYTCSEENVVSNVQCGSCCQFR